MSDFLKDLENKASIVIGVENYLDTRVSNARRSVVMQAILNEGRIEFYSQLINVSKGTSFVYGDKYFAPTSDNEWLISIPKGIKLSDLRMQLSSLIKQKKYVNLIADDFIKMKHLLSDHHFDLSQ